MSSKLLQYLLLVIFIQTTACAENKDYSKATPKLLNQCNNDADCRGEVNWMGQTNVCCAGTEVIQWVYDENSLTASEKLYVKAFKSIGLDKKGATARYCMDIMTTVLHRKNAGKYQMPRSQIRLWQYCDSGVTLKVGHFFMVAASAIYMTFY